MVRRRRAVDLARIERARRALDELVRRHPELTRPEAAERLARALEAEPEDLEAALLDAKKPAK